MPSTRVLARAVVGPADDHGGVLSRALLAVHGIDRHRIRNEVAAGRWRCHGRHTIALHTTDLSPLALRWRAVWEVGATRALLDGTSSLIEAGLEGFDVDQETVSVHHVAKVPAVAGVRVRKVRWRLPEDRIGAGVPRTGPAIAAIRSAHWAASDRQAALLLAMSVQQRLTTGERLRAASASHAGRTRRAFIATVIGDVCDGAHSLGELDFAAMCRRRGLPEPDRQVVRHGPDGRVYLDVGWHARRLVVEIDGSGHRRGLSVTADNLRANAVTLGADRVLRIDLLGLRVCPEAFLDQVTLGLAS